MEQLRRILAEAKIIEAKSLSDKVNFKHFFIEELEGVGEVQDTEDLADRSSLKMLLITDQNFHEDTLGDDAEYTVKTSDLFKYLETNVPEFAKTDYIDFMSEYSLMNLVGSYIADAFGLVWHRDYESLRRVVDNAERKESLDVSRENFRRGA